MARSISLDFHRVYFVPSKHYSLKLEGGPLETKQDNPKTHKYYKHSTGVSEALWLVP